MLGIGGGRTHVERHRTEHAGWLRTGVRGANDGLISTSSLVVGVAAAAGAERVTFWGAVALACTALVGRLFGTVM